MTHPETLHQCGRTIVHDRHDTDEGWCPGLYASDMEPPDTTAARNAAAQRPLPVTPGESVYRLHGWSGCEGSRWETLSTATQDGWEHAARLTARLADLTDRLGYGDGITEPQAPNDVIVAGIEAERTEAAEWREHQSWLNDCAAAGCDPLEDCPTHAPACHPAHYGPAATP